MFENNFVDSSKLKIALPTQLSNSLHPSLSPSPSSIQIDNHAPATSEPEPKRRRATSSLRLPATVEVSADLGTYIQRDVKLLKERGWTSFVNHRRQRGDFAEVSTLPHPASRLLQHYKVHGAPVKFTTEPWKRHTIERALARGPHRSCMEHIDFLHEEFIDMINKQQWIILPFSEAKNLPNLRLSPPGVVPQRGRRPRWIVDYSWWNVNSETLPLAPKEAMQFGHALDRILREILLADPNLGPVYLSKLDISDGFYRINLAVEDIPKLGVVFPVKKGEEPLVAFPLVLPMGWANSPPIFCAATETAADLANAAIASSAVAPKHPLDEMASSMDDPSPPHASPAASKPAAIPAAMPSPKPTPAHSARLVTPTLDLPPASSRASPSAATPAALPSPMPTPAPSASLEPPIARDPSLPSSFNLAAYIDVFVDDFLALCQGTQNRRRVRRLLLQAIDQVFRPNDFHDNQFRREPVSIKKLKQGDVSWNTVKTVLGWIINTTAMTIELPPHRADRLAEILASIPLTQKRIAVRKWHKVLGELRSMSVALPGARNMFSQMQKALSDSPKTRVALTKGVHQALEDFRWMHKNISSRPTRIAELVPLLSSAIGDHDASGKGAGGVWFPHESLDPRGDPTKVPSHDPLLWRLEWPQDIIDKLVTEKNPTGTITNSDLELAGGLLHLEAICQHYDVRERTLLSRTDNLATLFWQRKGSATTHKVPAHLLRLFGIHQRYHRYVPRHDYISGVSNPMADDASRLFYMSDAEFLAYFNSTFPQVSSFHHVHLPPQVISSVISALRRKTCKAESLLVEPPPPIPTGKPGTASQLNWASIPYSKPSRTKYQSYKSSDEEFVPENLQQTKVQSSLERLKITYGLLARRTSPWGPQTHA